MPFGPVRKNTPQLWDEVWARAPASEEDLDALANERAGARFQRMTARVLDRFGGFENLDVLEIGAGAGTNAALFASLGATVTVLDYSDRALERSSVFFERNGITASQVHADALDLPSNLVASFDVSMSFGLAEHFVGEDRTRIIRSHLDVLRPGGVTFVSVPNTANPPYRLYKLLTQRTRLWNVGEEYPFSRRELESICSKLGVRDYSFFGDSLLESWRFIDPVAAARKILGAKPSTRTRARLQRGTRFDDRFAYALVLCAAR
jgi:2-polyprenyl-3-methyl-5-hydroxy-6-metoxy-1,4-benzoquinol methylase